MCWFVGAAVAHRSLWCHSVHPAWSGHEYGRATGALSPHCHHQQDRTARYTHTTAAQMLYTLLTNAVDFNFLCLGALEMGQEVNSAALMELQGHIGRFQVKYRKKSIWKLIFKRRKEWLCDYKWLNARYQTNRS